MSETLQHSPEEAETFNAERESAREPVPEEQTYSDPRAYVDEFEKSIDFAGDVVNRLEKYTAEHPVEELSQADVQQFKDTLRTASGYKEKLWDWQKEHKLSLKPETLPEEVTQKVYDYWNVMEDIAKIRRDKEITPEEAQNLDIERSAKHTLAAKELVDNGLAPNITVGRLLVHFMSIEKGYDRRDPQRDERRLNFFR